LRQQVQAARQQQNERNGGPLHPNATLSHRQLDDLAPMDQQAQHVLKQAMTELGLSARAYDKIRRVGRTIADLEQVETLSGHHIAEAVQYRFLDRQM
jgi:magnesium chelatase family protein